MHRRVVGLNMQPCACRSSHEEEEEAEEEEEEEEDEEKPERQDGKQKKQSGQHLVLFGLRQKPETKRGQLEENNSSHITCPIKTLSSEELSQKSKPDTLAPPQEQKGKNGQHFVLSISRNQRQDGPVRE